MPDITEQEMWWAALDDHVARFYAANPLPTYDDLPVLERYQAQLIGEAALPWINGAVPTIWRDRIELCKTMDIGPTPRVVVLTDFPGLVVMKLLLPDDASFISVLPHDSFASFLDEHPDVGLRWHVIYSCYFSNQLTGDVLKLARSKYRLRASEEYWVHCEISAVDPSSRSGTLHLWIWNGQEMALLEQEFDTWTS